MSITTQLLTLAVEAGGRLLARSWRRRLLVAGRRGVLLMTRLIRLSFGLVMVMMVVLIVRLLNSEKGGAVGLTLLQALAQVPESILQLLVS